MSEPFLSEIRQFSFNFPPKGWALCNGQLLPINQNQALFALLGTTYGGNGQTNFALPNLRSRVAIHQDGAHSLGQTGGEQVHTLTIAELPMHAHQVNASSAPGTTNAPIGNFLAAAPNLYGDASGSPVSDVAMGGLAGGSQPHQNMQPYLVTSFCIALQGIFPSQN